MNTLIKNNLHKLFNASYHSAKNSDLRSLSKNSKAFDINLGFITNLYDNNDLKNLKKALKNPLLISALENAISINLNEAEVIEKLIIDIRHSIQLINEEVKQKNSNLKNQIIFLEYDYDYQACLCGFGEGTYPILDKPEYVSYNYHEELYNGLGKIDLTGIFNHLIQFNELSEELNIYDQICHSDFYQKLIEAYQYKACIMLNEAFTILDSEIFVQINIAKPLNIYLNEHDCPAMNVYASI